jgi:hypothetical protein
MSELDLTHMLSDLYAEACARPDVPDPTCGRTPREHFVVGSDGVARLRGECIHGGTITAERIYLPLSEEKGQS